MSKAFVNKMLAELIAKGSTKRVYKEARRESDASGMHAVSVYKSSLKHYESDIDVEQAYKRIYIQAKKEFKEGTVTDDGTKITVVMPDKYSDRLINIVRDSMMIAEASQAHFAHSGDTTVGIRILARSAEMSKKQLAEAAKQVDLGVRYNKKKAVIAFQEALESTLNEANWSWSSKEKLSAFKYLKTMAITGSIVPAKFNKAGSEELDLSKLKVRQLYADFEKAFMKELKLDKAGYLQKFGTMSASPSPVDKISSTVINNFVDSLNTPIQKRKTPKRVKAKSDKSNVPKTARRAKKAPAAKMAIEYHKNTEKNLINLKALIPQLNAGLPQVVINNMGSPSLVNRTGRFANSVEVVDITTTEKGYPSIAYTYQKNPYGVFEYPGGDVFRATEDRDPRNIINRSIREKAVGIMNGRFYTRRV